MIELPFDSQSFPNSLFREAFCQLFFHNLPTIQNYKKYDILPRARRNFYRLNSGAKVFYTIFAAYK